jgi:periplasmic protein TonB
MSAVLIGETQDPASGAGFPIVEANRHAFVRWSICAAVAILAHALIAPLVLHWQTDADAVAPAATIVIELSPVVAAPLVQELEAPPVPEQIQGEIPVAKMIEEDVEDERKVDEETFQPKLEMVEPKLEMTPLPLPEVKRQADAEAIKPASQQAPVVAVEEKSDVELAPPPKQDNGRQVEAPRSAPSDAMPYERKAPPTQARRAARKPRKQGTDRTDAPPQVARAETAPVRAPAASTPSNSNARASWISQIMGILRHNTHYPPEAKARHEEGVSNITFSLNRQGHVTSARITRSSGSPALDADALALVRRVQPFPPPPPEVLGAQNQITLNAPIHYYLPN